VQSAAAWRPLTRAGCAGFECARARPWGRSWARRAAQRHGSCSRTGRRRPARRHLTHTHAHRREHHGSPVLALPPLQQLPHAAGRGELGPRAAAGRARCLPACLVAAVACCSAPCTITHNSTSLQCMTTTGFAVVFVPFCPHPETHTCTHTSAPLRVWRPLAAGHAASFARWLPATPWLGAHCRQAVSASGGGMSRSVQGGSSRHDASDWQHCACTHTRPTTRARGASSPRAVHRSVPFAGAWRRRPFAGEGFPRQRPPTSWQPCLTAAGGRVAGAVTGP
jgi:hypothetical protein